MSHVRVTVGERRREMMEREEFFFKGNGRTLLLFLGNFEVGKRHREKIGWDHGGGRRMRGKQPQGCWRREDRQMLLKIQKGKKYVVVAIRRLVCWLWKWQPQEVCGQ
jgi:hypothetical protein